MKTPKQLTPASIRALRRIKAHILQEPKRFAMGFWSWQKAESPYPKPPSGPNAWNGGNPYEAQSVPQCGTVACIGGWSELLGLGGILHPNLLWPLISVDRWPEPLKAKYKKARTPSGRAKLAGQAIEEFIKLDGEWGLGANLV
jgi:hypothetical protein